MGAVTIESTPQTENRHQQKHDSWWNPMKKETTTRKRTSETNISISLPNPMNLLILTYFDLVISHCFHHISTFRFPPGRAVPWRSPAVNPSAAPGLRDPSATMPLRGHLTEKRSFVCVIFICTCLYTYTHTYIYIYVHIYIYAYIFMHLFIYSFYLFIDLFVRVRFWIKCGSKKERYQFMT